MKYAGAHVRSSGGSEGSHLLMQIKQMGGPRYEENSELLIEEYLWLKRLYTEIQWYDPTCSNLQRFTQTERPHNANPSNSQTSMDDSAHALFVLPRPFLPA